MVQREIIFLTRGQALASVCFDFRQYGPQILLFCEILRLISRGTTVVKKDTKKGGLWISTATGRHMRWLEGNELVEYLCETVTAADLDAKTLAAVCARVFQTRAVPVKDPIGGQAGIHIDTGMESYRCRQCGHCCTFLDYHAEVTADDVRRWEQLQRADILEWVGRTRTADGNIAYQIWMKPGTRQLAKICPFLQIKSEENRSICRIHDVKPFICRNYPVSRKHARMTGCPGFDPLLSG